MLFKSLVAAIGWLTSECSWGPPGPIQKKLSSALVTLVDSGTATKFLGLLDAGLDMHEVREPALRRKRESIVVCRMTGPPHGVANQQNLQTGVTVASRLCASRMINIIRN